ncbi:MAG: hypothetical protein RXO24_11605 [Acidilobus sp.]
MAVDFENPEEEIMRKANKILKTASVACLDLPYELKEYVIEECKNYLGQRSADPSEVCRCLSQAVKNLAKLLEQCSDDLSKSKTCSDHEDEAW